MPHALVSIAASLPVAQAALAGGSPPQLQSTLEIFTGDLVLLGRVLYQTQFFDDTRLTDLAAPCDPVFLPAHPSTGGAEEIHIDGQLAAIRSPSGGVQIVDVSDPSDPVTRSVVDLPGDERQAVISDGVLYVSAQSFSPTPSTTYSRVSLANPDTPGPAQTILTPPAGSTRFGVSGGVLAYTSGIILEIVDVSGPGAASPITSFTIPGGVPVDPVLEGELCVVGLLEPGSSSVVLINLSDAAAPEIHAFIPVEGRISDRAMDEGVLYVAVECPGGFPPPAVAPGVLAVDISNPAKPATRWFLETGFEPREVAAGHGLVVVNGIVESTSVYADEFCAPVGCSPADLAEPFGVLNFNDVLAFLDAFGAGAGVADLAPPIGTLNFNDVLEFLVLFGRGCPI